MDLLLGSGRTYKFLATKILSEYPNGLMQASSQYEGPQDENSLSNWVPLNEFPGELVIGSNETELMKSKEFKYVYFCIPNFPDEIIGEVFPAYTLAISILATHIIPYVCLLKEVSAPNVTVHVFADIKGDTFLQKVVLAVLRPMLMEALASVPSKLIYTRTSSVIEEQLEAWWADINQTHNLIGKDK